MANNNKSLKAMFSSNIKNSYSSYRPLKMSISTISESQEEVKRVPPAIKLPLTDELFNILLEQLSNPNTLETNGRDVMNLFEFTDEQLLTISKNFKSDDEENFPLNFRTLLLNRVKNLEVFYEMIDIILDEKYLNNWSFGYNGIEGICVETIYDIDNLDIEQDDKFTVVSNVIEKFYKFVCSVEKFTEDNKENFLNHIINNAIEYLVNSKIEVPECFIEEFNQYITPAYLLRFYKENSKNPVYSENIVRYIKKQCEKRILDVFGPGTAGLVDIKINFDMNEIALFDELSESDEDDLPF